MNEFDLIQRDLIRIKKQEPLIHNICNLVVMNFVANSLLALGASPIMAHAAQEMVDIAALADVLVLNIGTLDKIWLQSMLCAQQHVNHAHKPIVLDPAGVGASALRQDAVRRLLSNGVTVLKGNAAEILSIAGISVQSSGVDSKQGSEEALIAAHAVSHQYNCIVIISGCIDYVVEKNKLLAIHGGDPIMKCITGMGCMASAAVGAFLAVNTDYFSASSYAMKAIAVAGETAIKQANGPGSMVACLLDQLYTMHVLTLSEKQRELT